MSAPNVPRVLGIAFSTIGALFLLIGVWRFTVTYAFVSNAVSTTGTIVGHVEELSRDSDNRTRHLYAPRFRFVSAAGQSLEVVSRQASSSRDPVGTSVAVLYSPSDPRDAELDSAWQWAFSALFGGIGGCFFVLGVVFLIRSRLASRRREDLLMHGTPIQARFVGVERNTSIEYNGCNPWRLLCQWQDPVDASVHVFRSDDIWFDPTEYVASSSVRVLIDPASPTRYHVDLSFLPALARA